MQRITITKRVVIAEVVPAEGPHPSPIHAALHAVAEHWTAEYPEQGDEVEFAYDGVTHTLTRSGLDLNIPEPRHRESRKTR